MAKNITLPEKLEKELINITKKENTIDAITELIRMELMRKKNKNIFMVREFGKKYKMKFEDFEKKYKNTKMNYDMEKDYFNWDMAVTVLEDIEDELKEIQ